LNSISISINYITNFKPSKNFSENYSFYKNKNNIILCKHFLIFFYLMKISLKNNADIKIFLKPKRRKLETLLRAPYRHKISRHQITISRYNLVVVFKLNLKKNILCKSITQLTFLIKEITTYFSFFETNICYSHSLKIRFFFKNNQYFNIMNYKQ
jgi:hypothetical protein